MNETSGMHARDGGHDVAALTVEEARRRILAEVAPVHGVEKLALCGARQRLLAQAIHSPFNVPAHTNSAVDGYALAGRELPAAGERAWRVAGTAWAGRAFAGTVAAGECVRIMTGAPLPADTDTVVMQEQVQLRGDSIRIGAGHQPGQNVRAAGEDLARGQVVLTAGQMLRPADLGLLASIGLGEVAVYRRLRVAFFSTGDELRSIGEPLGAGEIYDSNRYTLHAMLARLGVELIDMGVVRDDRTAVRQAFLTAAEIADAVITSGGVSVGEADYVKETLEALGEVRFWRIAMKPGRPLAFGRVGHAAFFGLPGNPVSVMVTFYQFVQPALRRMMGETGAELMPLTFRVASASRYRKRPGRTEFQRGILARDAGGGLVVRSTGSQGSGILHSMSVANCFVILPHDSGDVEPGTLVEVQPFFGLI
jgi:molybdopterin molybdotransferase